MKRKLFLISTMVIFLSIFIGNPLFAKVTKAIGRELQRPDDIVISNRKANFGIGDIINLDIASIQIVNDEIPAYLLLELELDIDSPSIADDTTATIKLVKRFESNENFTFTNKDLLNYIQYYKSGDVPQSIRDAFGLSDLDSITESFFNSSNKDMPEGTYTISLLAYEIDTEDDDIGRELREKQSVTFKVAHIDDIEIIQKPTVKNKLLKFRVPEIPYYSDTSIPNTSKTFLTITGLEMNETLDETHSRVTASSSSELKGYPSDLSQGLVSYDLSSINFRAGESYTFNIVFKDAYNHEIKNNTFSVDFPTPRFSSYISFDDPYNPYFNWAFNDDYESWVSEYRLYINNSYQRTTSNNFQYSYFLNPSTNYTWYVMPINKDGTNFFSSDSIIKSFKTKDHDEIDVEIEDPIDNATLIKDFTYDFSAIASYSDNIQQKQAVWHIGSNTIDGINISYTPQKRYSSNSLLAYLYIEDELGLSLNSPYIYLSVLDPKISIEDNFDQSISQNSSLFFSTDQNTYDVDTIEWFLDNNNIGSGTNISYDFSEIGTYSLQAKAISKSDYLGRTKEVESQEFEIEVIGEAPSASIDMENDEIQIIKGSDIKIKSNYTTYNPVKSFSWTYSGVESGTLSNDNNEVTFTPTKAGEYQITFTIIDKYNKSSSASIRVLSIDPKITISNIRANANYSIYSTLNPIVSAPSANNFIYMINGEKVLNNDLSSFNYTPGTYTFSVKGFWDVSDNNGNIISYEKESDPISFTVVKKEPPQIELLNPTYPYTFINNVTYNLAAEVETTSNIENSWWEVNGNRLYSNSIRADLYSTPSNNTITISYHVIDEDGLSASKSHRIKVLYPLVNITEPAISNIAQNELINIQAETKDSSLFWIINDQRVSSWDKSISEIGDYTIQAGWETTALDKNGDEKTYTGESKKVEITIYNAQPPKITAFSPSNEIIQHAENIPLTFEINVAQALNLKPIQWQISKYVGSNSQIIKTIENNKKIALSSWKKGVYKIKAICTDIYNRRDTHQWSVNVSSPEAIITYPLNNEQYALNQIEKPIFSLVDVDDYILSLNGNVISKDFDFSSLSKGNYTLSIKGVYNISNTSNLQETKTNSVSFKIIDLTPPIFDVDIIKNNDRLITGFNYELSASASADETFIWYLNDKEVKRGETFNYTPQLPSSYRNTNKKYYDNILLKATRNGISKEKSFKLNIIDPYYEIKNNASYYDDDKLYYANNEPIHLSYESRFIDKVVWKVDGKTTRDRNISFSSGQHEIKLDGYASGIRYPDGSLKNHMPENSINSIDVIIVDKQKVISIDAPNAIIQGNDINISVNTSKKQPMDFIKNISCYVDGNLYKKNNNGKFIIKSLSPGNHTIKIVSLDYFNRSETLTHNLSVYKPLVASIISPQEGQRLSPDKNLFAKLDITSGQAKNISWSIDNRAIPYSNSATIALGKLSSGKHSIEVNVVDILNKKVSDKIYVETLSDLQLNMIQPNNTIEVIKNNSVQCLAGIEKVSGSSASVKDAANHISWYVNNRNTYEKGLSYTFDAEKIGRYKIYAKYDFNNMERTSSERTIIVKNIEKPVIISPKNGERITYSNDNSINLEATGEVGSEFIWKIGNEIVAIGANTEFNPSGQTGNIQLSLTTKAYGQSLQSMVSFNLIKNTPPALALSVSPNQYTTNKLKFSAKASDLEDKNDNLVISYLLDGIALDEDYTLTKKDVGMHTLTAIAKDSLDEATIEKATFKVLEKNLSLDVLSPQDNYKYYKGFEIPLIASLPQGEKGSFIWNVNYLDSLSFKGETFNTSEAVFKAADTGKVEVNVSFIDSNNQERANKSMLLNIEAEPIELSINWPHGKIVNQGEKLNPTLHGLSDNQNINLVTWYLEGKEVNDINNLFAPNNSGDYTLSALYIDDDISERASIDFSVNTKPIITIDKAISEKDYLLNKAIILSAKVEDDQEYQGDITWILNNSEVLGKSNPIIYMPKKIGKYNIVAKVEDNYQLSAKDEINIKVYKPISDIVVNFNNGLPSYLISKQSPPLVLNSSYTGGNNSKVTWSITQANNKIEKIGKNVEFNFDEINKFMRTSALINMNISDKSLVNGEEKVIIHKEFIINFTNNATLKIINPQSSSMYRLNQEIPIEVAFSGYKNPELTLFINDVQHFSKWIQSEDSQKAITNIPFDKFENVGVYEIKVVAKENNIINDNVVSLNIYPAREGIFIDNVVKTFDINNDSTILNATIENLKGVDKIQWKSDLSNTPIAVGKSLDLSKASLKAGKRSITVQAFSKEKLLSSKSILIDVIDKVHLSIETTEETLIIQNGADVELKANAKDIDGSIIDRENIIWKSHDIGYLANGNILSFKKISNLSNKKHIISVEAIGKDGSKETDFINVEIREKTDDTGQKNSATNLKEKDEKDQEDKKSEELDYFDLGKPINNKLKEKYQDPFGSNASNKRPDPKVSKAMEAFLNNHNQT